MCHSNSSKTDEPRASIQDDDDDDLETDGDSMTKHYYHKNSDNPGHIIFTVSCFCCCCVCACSVCCVCVCCVCACV